MDWSCKGPLRWWHARGCDRANLGVAWLLSGKGQKDGNLRCVNSRWARTLFACGDGLHECGLFYLPEDEQTDFFSFKEVAAGLGGMGEAAAFLGLRGTASMDINHMACNALHANGKGIEFFKGIFCEHMIVDFFMKLEEPHAAGYFVAIFANLCPDREINEGKRMRGLMSSRR